MDTSWYLVLVYVSVGLISAELMSRSSSGKTSGIKYLAVALLWPTPFVFAAFTVPVLVLIIYFAAISGGLQGLSRWMKK